MIASTKSSSSFSACGHGVLLLLRRFSGPCVPKFCHQSSLDRHGGLHFQNGTTCPSCDLDVPPTERWVYVPSAWIWVCLRLTLTYRMQRKRHCTTSKPDRSYNIFTVLYLHHIFTSFLIHLSPRSVIKITPLPLFPSPYCLVTTCLNPIIHQFCTSICAVEWGW